MTDHNCEEREALIEKAAMAINSVRWNHALPHANRGGVNWTDADLARAAFAVFEQAHTPTGDERDDLIALLLRSREWNVADRADAILAAGFRRTVQGDPTAALSDYLRTKGFNPSRMGNWDTGSGVGLAREAFLAGWAARERGRVNRVHADR